MNMVSKSHVTLSYMAAMFRRWHTSDTVLELVVPAMHLFLQNLFPLLALSPTHSHFSADVPQTLLLSVSYTHTPTTDIVLITGITA